MTAVRTLTVAVGSIAVEAVCLLLVLGGAFEMWRFDSLRHAPYWVRASGAVATTGVFLLTGGASAAVALGLGRRWLRSNVLGAVFIVAVVNAPALYFLLGLVTWANDDVWNIPFPYGGGAVPDVG